MTRSVLERYEAEWKMEWKYTRVGARRLLYSLTMAEGWNKRSSEDGWVMSDLRNRSNRFKLPPPFLHSSKW